MTPREKFDARLSEPDSNGCVIWKGEINTNGYGRFTFRGRKWYAHRLNWIVTNGPVPDGLQLDHLCRVRACVNPDHLEPVTASVNVRRGLGPQKVSERNRLRSGISETSCAKGHEFDAKNTYVDPLGQRRCRACLADTKRRYRALHGRTDRNAVNA